MKKEIVTLGGVSRIIIRLGESTRKRLNGVSGVIVEFRLIFESRNDKIYKLIKDYIHLLNSVECDTLENSKGMCLLCESMIQECEVKNGRKKTTILLAKSHELEIKDLRITWDISQELKHYKLIGIFSNSTTSNFLFPLTMLQYSNSKMFLNVISVVNYETIWSSNTFLMNNFIKCSDTVDNSKQDETQIYINTKSKDYTYIYNEHKVRIVNNGHINQNITEKYQIRDVIKKSIELHSVLKSYRGNLRKLHSLKKKCNERLINDNGNSKFDLIEKNDRNNDSYDGNETDVIEEIRNLYHENSPGFIYRTNIKVRNGIKDRIEELNLNHRCLEDFIRKTREEIRKEKIRIIKLQKVINLYRNNLFDIISYCIYPITIENKTGGLNIRNLPLPIINVIQNLDNKQQPEISTSLGYSLHYIEVISKILGIPLSSKISVQGSFSTINDSPLYLYPNVNKRQVKKALFYLKSVIFYELLNYFNVNQSLVKNLLSSNNILFLIISIRNFVKGL